MGEKKNKGFRKNKTENSEFFNLFLHQLWPFYRRSIAESTKQSLKKSLEESLEQQKPTGVEDIHITSIDFGDDPPILANISSMLPPFGHYRADFDFRYQGI